MILYILYNLLLFVNAYGGIRPNFCSFIAFLVEFFALLRYNSAMKLWIRSMRDEKIIADEVYYTKNKTVTTDELVTVLLEFADQFDLSSPTVLPTHTQKLNDFNITRFDSSDFVHYVDFDTLVIEVIKE